MVGGWILRRLVARPHVLPRLQNRLFSASMMLSEKPQSSVSESSKRILKPGAVSKIDPGELEKHIKVLESEKISQLGTTSLLKLLRTLEESGQSADEDVIKNIENAILWCTRNEYMSNIIGVLDYVNKTQGVSQSRRDMFQVIRKLVERRY